MPIQILDNFEVNISKPIDNRFVVGSQSFYTNKEQIPYRYPGLRIWDLNDSFPYVWTGLTWSNENQSGVVIGSGTAGFLPKFFGSNPTSNIVNSQIFDNGSSVGIGKTDPASKLDVLGSIRVSGSGNSFVGPGQGITMIDATNISVGNLSLQRITAGNNGDIMVRGSSNAQFVNPSSITVGTASNLTITPVSNNAVYHVPFFSGTTGLPGNRQIFATSSSIQINPSTGNVSIGTSPSSTNRLTVSGTVSITGGNVGIGTSPSTTNRLTVSGTASVSNLSVNIGSNTNPSINFTGEINTGIYRSSTNNIDFTLGGTRSINFWRNEPNATEIRFYNGLTQMGAFVSWHGSTKYLTIGSGWEFVEITHTTTPLGANCYIESPSGRIFRSTSSLKYKKDIEDLDVDIENYKKIRPVRYKSNIIEDNERSYIGFIAEEIHDIGYHEFVHYDKDGRPDGLGYGNFTSLNTAVIQNLLKRIEELERKLI